MPDSMPTNSTSDRSFSSPLPSRKTLTTRIDDDRQQRDQRGVDRPDQGLVQRQVGGLAVAGPPRREQAGGVLPDLVEDHHGVVQRVTQDRQQPDHGRRADLEAQQRVDADRDHDVVQQRDQRRRRHPPLERDRQVDHDHDQERDQRLEAFCEIWLPQLGPIDLRLTWSAAGGTWPRSRSGPRTGSSVLRTGVCTLQLVPPICLDVIVGTALPAAVDRVRDLRGRRRRGRELVDRPALEVHAVVQPRNRSAR